MKTPIEILKETETLLFSLEPKEARKLKAITIQLLKRLPYPKYTQLIHQISQERKYQANFLSWLNDFSRVLRVKKINAYEN